MADTSIFAGTYDDCVYRSTDTGSSWKLCGYAIIYPVISALGINGSHIFVGNPYGIYVSSDIGATWDQIIAFGPSQPHYYTALHAFAFIGSNVFVGKDDGLYMATDNGTSWRGLYGLAGSAVRTFQVNGTDLFAGTSLGVLVSNDTGRSWKSVNAEMADSNIISLQISGDYMLAGTAGGAVWRRPLSEVTGVKTSMISSPTQFSLGQNYPNPFNPTTTITFSVPTHSLVSLKVFDILGREVATVLSEQLPAGNYSRQWSAQHMPSGVYFYRLHAGSFTETKKLVLLK